MLWRKGMYHFANVSHDGKISERSPVTKPSHNAMITLIFGTDFSLVTDNWLSLGGPQYSTIGIIDGLNILVFIPQLLLFQYDRLGHMMLCINRMY